MSGYGNQGQLLKFVDSSGSPSIHTLALPKVGGVQVPSATISFAAYPLYPQYIESAISKCPGDFTYWQSAGAVSAYGQTFYPCHLTTDGGSASSMYYNTTGAYDTCQVPADGTTWYVNIRYISNAPTAPASINGWPLNGTYGCSGSCTAITSWGPH